MFLYPVKTRKKKPWLAWVLGLALCSIVPVAIIGKASWNEFRARVGSNKEFISNLVKDYYDGKPIDDGIMEAAREPSKKVLADAGKQMGMFKAFETVETIPTFNDAISKGWELSYNLPVRFEKGYKTFTIRVRNDKGTQKIVSMASMDGISARRSIKNELKQHLP